MKPTSYTYPYRPGFGQLLANYQLKCVVVSYTYYRSWLYVQALDEKSWDV